MTASMKMMNNFQLRNTGKIWASQFFYLNTLHRVLPSGKISIYQAVIASGFFLNFFLMMKIRLVCMALTQIKILERYVLLLELNQIFSNMDVNQIAPDILTFYLVT